MQRDIKSKQSQNQGIMLVRARDIGSMKVENREIESVIASSKRIFKGSMKRTKILSSKINSGNLNKYSLNNFKKLSTLT